MSPNNKDKDLFYLAYGTNLNVQNMIKICPDALLLEVERLYGFRLVFRGPHNGEAWVSLVKDENSSVPVAMWQVTPKDKEALMAYERVPEEHDEIHLILNHRHCFTYIIKPSYPFSEPSHQYFQTVEQGYKNLGFDLLDLQQALLNH